MASLAVRPVVRPEDDALKTIKINSTLYTKYFVVWPYRRGGTKHFFTEFEKKDLFFNQKNLNYYLNNKGKVEKVTSDLAQYLKWNLEDIKENRLFRVDCFFDVMGFYEAEFRDFSQKKEPKWAWCPLFKTLQQSLERFVLTNPYIKKNPQWNALCGSRFSTLTIEKLKKEIELQQEGEELFKPSDPGRFHLIDGYAIKEKGSWQEALKQTDIAYLQENNPGALFQIASTFNALEGSMGLNEKDYGRYIETMQFTPTQGENAALATMGATIIRKYCTPPINLLERLSNKITMNNKPGRSGTVFKISPALIKEDGDVVAIGLHSNVVVTSGYYGCYSEKFSGKFSKSDPDAQARITFMEDRQIVKKDREPFFIFNSRLDLSDPKKLIRIDQVFTAALRLEDTKDKTQIANAKILLKAAYQGTMLAAALRVLQTKETNKKQKKVFLTLVGAGAFHNKIKWIVEILKEPWFIEIIEKFGLDVYLVIYPSTRSDKTTLDSELNNLRDLEKTIQSQLDKKTLFTDVARALAVI